MILEDDVDVGRGEILVDPEDPPQVTNELCATVCWMADKPLTQGNRYVLKHATKSVRAIIDELDHRLDVNTLHRNEEATHLGLNEIGVVQLRLSAPLPIDSYHDNRTMGSFILIDESSNSTVGAGMILSAVARHAPGYTI
jgi:bifunctional enzyme CysN/CysC